MVISRSHTIAGLASSVSIALSVGIGCQKPSPPVVQHPAAAAARATSTLEAPAPAQPTFENAVDHKYPHGILVKRYQGAETSVAIPDAIDGRPVVRIEGDAFHGNDRLRSVRLPASLLEIGNMTFRNCTSLNGVVLPDALRSIGWNAFENCGLEKVRIPGKVTHIGDVCFFGCKNLSIIEVDAMNPAYASVDGVLYDKGVTTLLYCPLAKEGILRLPATVTAIKEWAFANCNKLTQVFIPAATRTIGENAFTGCGASRITERRNRWVANAEDDRHAFQRSTDGTWKESSEAGNDTFFWREVKSTPEYVFLRDDSRNMQVRLGEQGSEWRLMTEEEKWNPLKKGGWEEASSDTQREKQPGQTSAEKQAVPRASSDRQTRDPATLQRVIAEQARQVTASAGEM